MALQVWLPLDGDLHNQGLNNVEVRSNNITFTNGKIGQCASFNGSSSYIYIPNFSIGNNWSYGCWINTPDSTSRGWEIIIILNNSGSDADTQFSFWVNQKENRFQSTANTQYNSTISYTNYYNSWHHFFATFNGSILTTYIDGIIVDTKTITASLYIGSNLTIGARATNVDGTSFSSYTEGFINDVRIYDHCLSPKEVEEIAKGLVLHYKLDGETQIMVPSGYQQLDYIESAGAAWFNTGYYFNPETDACKIIFKGNDTSNNGMIFASSGGKYFWLYYYSAGMNIYATNSSGTQKSVTGPSRDTNQHTVIYQNKHYYFDGVDKGTLADSYVQDTAESYLFSYGASGTNYPFKGRIYYVEISRNNVIQKIFIPVKQLSDNAIGMYDIVGKHFKPSMTSTAFTAGPNASITGVIYDSSGYSNNGTIVGSLTAAAGSPRYDIATVFPTASDYFYFPHLVDSAAMNNEFTFSGWIYRDYTDATARYLYYGLCQIYLHTDFKPRIQWRHASADLSYDSGNAWATGSVIAAQTWTHLVFTFKDGVLYCYVNGVQYGPSDRSGTGQFIHGTQGSPNASIGYTWIGKISDVRTYATALTAEQVKELYNTSMLVDASGNVSPRELGDLI